MKLEVTDISCGYSKTNPVLSNVSFSLNDGDICCILGRNGVGKSTLFKTILRLLHPIDGKVCIDGENVAKWSASKMASYFAYVSQSHKAVFPYLTEEFIMLGRMGKMNAFSSPSKKDEEVVDKIIEELNIEHLRNKPYTDMSGGERQLVTIAKALAQEPKVLVLDEPTANLDYGNKVLVMSRMKQLAESGLCIIFTSHDPEHALLLNSKTVILYPGRVPTFGNATEVITEKSMLDAYSTQMRVIEIVDETGAPLRVCVPLLKY